MNSTDDVSLARRAFLQTSTLATVTLVGRLHSADAQDAVAKTADAARKYRIGIIGASGRGDYGHHLDLVWRDVPGTEIIAIADAEPRGREAAGKRLGVSILYEDYRQMLAREKLDVVTVAPRWLDDREAMVIACADAGCHVLCEKPFAIDAASADRMLSACRAANIKSAVVHQQRAMPGIHELQSRLADGRLGQILALRARGKEDGRAGGEDMMVVGCHIFDLMVLLAGRPRWASAEVLQDGRSATASDVRKGKDLIGPIAGNCISATFGFSEGVHGYFESKSAARDAFLGPVLEITCSKGVVLVSLETGEQFVDAKLALSSRRSPSWEPLGPIEWRVMNTAARFAWCKKQIASDLLRAVEEDREPLSSGAAAAVAVEMVQAVYAAHLASSRITMPLTDRAHPLVGNTQS